MLSQQKPSVVEFLNLGVTTSILGTQLLNKTHVHRHSIIHSSSEVLCMGF